MSRREFSKQVCSIPGCESATVGRGYCRKHYSRWYKHGDPLAGATPKGELTRWLKEHVSYASDECLIWPFHCNTIGYGQVCGQNASRVMCELVNGPAPTPAHDAAHSCGKGHLACVSPRHVAWKTKRENQADRIAHGTASLGSQNPAAVLSEEQVLAIRRLAATKTHKEIAGEFEISRQHVTSIVGGKRWGWL